ncbi:MAG TPA: TRAM domain-containing protein [Vicinamibacterales bacterium]|jgi:23S rRNA (uracil1939-C5)-methyltransferase
MSGDTRIVEILRVDLEGDGVADVDGRSVSVPFTIPGERVEVRLGRDRLDRPAAELVRIVSPSLHRVTPACRHFGSCGGCAWQHIAYPEQLRLKQRLLQELLDEAMGRRAPRVELTLATPNGAPHGRDARATRSEDARATRSEDPRTTPSDDPRTTPSEDARGTRSGEPSVAPGSPGAPWAYRDKVHFVFGPGGPLQAIVMGHYRRGSRAVLPIEECPVHAEPGNRLAFRLRDALERAHVSGSAPSGGDGVARHVVVRVAEHSDEMLATLVVTENVKVLRRVTADVQTAETGRFGFHLNVNDRPGPFLFGRDTRRLFGLSQLRERVGDVSYLVSPTSFFQTNVRAAELLVREVLGALSDPRYERILDLYAGVGLFALPLALDGRTVTAAEENREAIESAAAAARLNRIPVGRLRLVAARVEEAMRTLHGRDARATRSGDARATRSGDARATRSGDARATRSGDARATRTRDARATRSGDARATRSGDARATRSGDARATRSVDARATRSVDARAPWDAVVLDPPRQGCPRQVIDWIVHDIRPGRIVYVSCNPEALARDLAAIPPRSYTIDRVQPVDMFPHTAHIESVAVLSRIAGTNARVRT